MCENGKQYNLFSGTANINDENEPDTPDGKQNNADAPCIDESERLISERNEYIKLLSTKIKTTRSDE